MQYIGAADIDTVTGISADDIPCTGGCATDRVARGTSVNQNPSTARPGKHA